MTQIEVKNPEGGAKGSVELPESVFAQQVSIPLIHQVVNAQLAAGRQGTHATKTRGEVRGGGRKPFRQKGTGRARQGSIRAPHYTGGGIVHGPKPRDYAQRTPKKMIKAALYGALTNRAAGERIHVIDELVPGQTPATKSARAFIERLTDRKSVLLVVEREDLNARRSANNLPNVHILEPTQLNAYDVLNADDVVFSVGALHAFVSRVNAADNQEEK